MSPTATTHKSVSKTLGRLLGLIALLLSSYTLCIAIPVADYEKQLQTATSLLQSLVVASDEQEATDYSQRVSDVTESIRQTLPRKETIQVGDQAIDVDNTWLHVALDVLESKSGAERQEAISDTIERLKAVEHSAAEVQKVGEPTLTKGEARTRLEEILKRAEYNKGPQGKNALSRLLEKIMEWIRNLLPKSLPLSPQNAGFLGLLIRIIVVAIAVAIIIMAVIAIVRRLSRIQKKPKKVREARVVLGERLEPEASATDLLTDAESLARSGDIRGAIRKAYIALLVELADRHLLSLAQHKTNRDYVRSVKTVPMLHSRMLTLTDSFERHWYGFIDATPSDWQDFRNGYQAALQTKS